MRSSRSARDPRAVRVLFLNHCAQLSGAEIALLRLLEERPVDLWASVVLAEHGPLVARLEAAGVPVEVHPVAVGADVRKDDVGLRALGPAVLAGWVRHVWQVVRVVRRDRPDVLHANNLKSALYGGVVGRLTGTPVVWHVRDSLTADYLPAPALRLVAWAARLLPSRVVANSVSTATSFEALVGARTARRLAPEVVYDVLPARALATVPARRTGGEVVTIAMVGRLAPWKGQDVFLRAFAAASADRPALRAVVAGSAMFGEDAYADALRSLTEELGVADRVTFLGYVADVPALLATADVLVHASISAEPFGQVIVEGMAAGLPVVAADLGGPREIVTDGVDGLLVAPGDHRGLADALGRLCDDPHAARRLAGRARHSVARFRAEASLPVLMACYRSLLSEEVDAR